MLRWLQRQLENAVLALLPIAIMAGAHQGCARARQRPIRSSARAKPEGAPRRAGLAIFMLYPALVLKEELPLPKGGAGGSGGTKPLVARWRQAPAERWEL